MLTKSFNLEEIIAKRNQKLCGFIDLAQKVDSSQVRLPYMIVCGAEDGPVLLVDCCVHGDEYEGAEAIARIYNQLDPTKMKGTFIGVPAVNLEAFNAGERVAPIDWTHLDMNRAFPGNPEGMITSRVSYFYFENFVKKADFCISFHGGGNGLYMEPLITYTSPNEKEGDMSYRAAVASGLKVWWNLDEAPFTGSLPEEARKVGIPCGVIELGGQGVRVDHRDEMISISANAIENIMKEFNMLEGNYEKVPEDEIKNVRIKYVHADDGGYHKLTVKAMDFVKKDQVCSEIVDIFGQKVNEVVAPFDCYIVGYWSYATIHPGNWAFLFGEPV
ncbi:succinylglutamate desuccinylase/aspartoacylase family protein [Gallibacter sp. Marseille-QA0791]|uniref:succinylglutamate desuccinylase/aspartoacylase family protein n=1 Tax=Gallibacter sp. Marseille-QA0791 TaxID=3378781 RepID=UPI003D136D64